MMVGSQGLAGPEPPSRPRRNSRQTEGLKPIELSCLIPIGLRTPRNLSVPVATRDLHRRTLFAERLQVGMARVNDQLVIELPTVLLLCFSPGRREVQKSPVQRHIYRAVSS